VPLRTCACARSCRALIASSLKEFWGAYKDPKAPSHAAIAALYRCYFFEAMRRDAFEEAYDVAKVRFDTRVFARPKLQIRLCHSAKPGTGRSDSSSRGE
jgi:hypothetical protein